MKKNMIILTRRILPAALALFLSTCAVFAAETEIHEPGFSNFTRKQDFNSGQFRDITINDWFYNSVQKVFELGLMSGKSPTQFAPGEKVKLCEAISMAAKTYDIYSGGNGVLPQSSDSSRWYNGAVDYAVNRRIIKADDFSDYEADATRAQLAYIFSGAVPSKTLLPINAVDAIPDVTEETVYGRSIMTLYRAGIVSGDGSDKAYHPEQSITRGEAASILHRIAVPDRRSSFTQMSVYDQADGENATPSALTFSDKDNGFSVKSSAFWLPAAVSPNTTTDSRLHLILTNKAQTPGKTVKNPPVIGELMAYVSKKSDAAAPPVIFHDLTVKTLEKELGGQRFTSSVHLSLPHQSSAYISPFLSGAGENALYWVLTAESRDEFITLVGRTRQDASTAVKNEIISVMKSLTLSGSLLPEKDKQ